MIKYILLFVLLLSILFCGRELFLFLRAIFSKNEEIVNNYKMTTVREILLGCAIAYIFTIIFLGL